MTPARTRRGPRFEYLTDAPPRDGRLELATVFAWRLVAGNNRPVGRCNVGEETLDDCVAAATTVRAQLARLNTTVYLDRHRSVWFWSSDAGGRTVAVSPHPYARRIECVRAAAQFAAAAQQADPLDGLVRNFGPRSLRDFTRSVRPRPEQLT